MCYKKLPFLILLVTTTSFSQILFNEEASAHGLAVNCGYTYFGNGVSFFDYDDDGWDDITINTGFGEGIRFFKNNNGSFNEQFLNVPSISYQTRQVNWVDYDNDGDKDIYVTSDTNGNVLWENDGYFNFTDITVASGLPTDILKTFGSSWGDINNDGYLDVFISNRNNDDSYTNLLYKNNGDGTFSDITVSAGVDKSSNTFCAAFFDYNNDGFQDIYISNDKLYTANVLYKNNGDETFDDVSEISGTNVYLDAMTVTVDDYNNDSWLDLYITNGYEGNVFLKNNGDGTFTDIAESSGTLFNSTGWGAVFFDAENDMDLDLYVSGSEDGSISGFISAAFYRQDAIDTFTLANDLGFDDDLGESYSNAIGDVNNDGLMEVIVSNNNEEDLYLWKNLTITNNNWLKVKLEGTASNRDGIGSFIEISVNDNKQYRYTLCGEGYLSQNSQTEGFGVGQNTMVDYVKVTWLSGIVDYFYNVAVNQVLEITEGTGTLSLNQLDKSKFRVFPNPARNLLTIESDINIQSLVFYDSIGKEIMNFKNINTPREEIDLKGISAGIYFLKIIDENAKFVIHKVVKN